MKQFTALWIVLFAGQVFAQQPRSLEPMNETERWMKERCQKLEKLRYSDGVSWSRSVAIGPIPSYTNNIYTDFYVSSVVGVLATQSALHQLEPNISKSVNMVGNLACRHEKVKLVSIQHPTSSNGRGSILVKIDPKDSLSDIIYEHVPIVNLSDLEAPTTKAYFGKAFSMLKFQSEATVVASSLKPNTIYDLKIDLKNASNNTKFEILGSRSYIRVCFEGGHQSISPVDELNQEAQMKEIAEKFPCPN